MVVKNDQVKELAGQVFSGSSSVTLKSSTVMANLEIEMKTSVPEALINVGK